VIIETIITTMAADGEINCAPMGVEWGDDTLVLKPFLETVTFRNLLATRAAVVHLTDDVRVFARGIVSNPVMNTVPATVVNGRVLTDCCSWREVQVGSVDATAPRSRIEAIVVHRGFRREFVGFNRAASAVIEMAIYATRLHILSRDFVEQELERLNVIVEKTAGPRETEAMAIVTEYIRSVPRERC